MKKVLSLLTVCALLISCMAFGATAEESDLLYGTMEIPYAEFYAAEGVAIDVDAVTSATDSKWKNEGLVAGTYNTPAEDGVGGVIEGVVYPVALTTETLAALGDDNYKFTVLDEIPAAYKVVSLDEDTYRFSAVQGDIKELAAEIALSTATVWGDYQITVSGISEIGTVYGVLITTDDGCVYAMRHLENIWRDSIGWSVGYTVNEPHGNALATENYTDMMGKTVVSITYITEIGYYVVNTELYLPIKYEGGIDAVDAAAADGQTTVSVQLPEDFEAVYSVKGLNCEVADGILTFADALPGSYTLNVEDASGVYAPAFDNFILSTDELPVAYDAESGLIVAVEGSSEELAAAFMANLSTVTVGEKAYNASGRGAVAIITEEGSVDVEAASVSGRGEEAVSTPVFAEDGEYTLTLTSVGFTQTLTFTITVVR